MEFRGDPVWFHYPMGIDQAVLQTDPAAHRMGDLVTQSSQFWLDIDGGSEMSGKTFKLITGNLSNTELNGLATSFISQFAVQYADENIVLRQLLFCPHVYSVSGAASQVSLTGPSSVNAGVVSTVFTLTSQDGSGNTVNVTSDTVFSLTSNSTGTATSYSDSAGTTAITEVTIANGNSRATFYYRDTAVGTPMVMATRTSGMSLGSDTHQITVSLASTTLATTTPTSYDCSVTKVEMHNGSSWVTIFSGTAPLDVVPGGTFPGVSNLSLPTGTYSQIRVTFTNSFPLKGSLSYSGATYYTTAATFGRQTNLASTPTTTAGELSEFTFRIEAWGAINTPVIQTFAITPVTVGPSTDYQPTLRFNISDKLLLKGMDGTPSTYYFALSEPTVSIVEP